MRGCTGARLALLLAGILVFSSVMVAGAQGRTGNITKPHDSELPTESVGPVSFVLDSGLFYTAEGAPLVEIYIQAPYDQLPFVKEAGGYVSRVEVVAVFQNISGDQVGGDSWSREIWVEDYGETIDQWTTYRAQAKFSLPEAMALLYGMDIVLIEEETLG